MKKRERFILGISLLSIFLVVIYYRNILSQYSGYEIVTCFQVKPDTKILKGTLIKNTDIIPVNEDKNKLPDDYVKNINDLKNKVALENLYGKDVLRDQRLEKKSSVYGPNEINGSLVAKDLDSLNGGDIKPGDIIDVYIYSTITKQYSSDLDKQNIKILNVKDKDGYDYITSKTPNFTPQNLFFKMDSFVYKDMINKLSDPQSKFRISVHGDRPNITRPGDSISNTNQPVIK